MAPALESSGGIDVGVAITAAWVVIGADVFATGEALEESEGIGDCAATVIESFDVDVAEVDTTTVEGDVVNESASAGADADAVEVVLLVLESTLVVAEAVDEDTDVELDVL